MDTRVSIARNDVKPCTSSRHRDLPIGASSKSLDLTDEERELIDHRIENGLEFSREILNDPSILEYIPDGSKVDAVFKEERDPAEHYDIETPRMVAKVTPKRRT